MRRICHAVVVLFLTTISMFAQTSVSTDLDVVATNKVPTTSFKKGDKFSIVSVTCDMSRQKGYDYILDLRGEKGQTVRLDLAKVPNLPVEYECSNKDEYWSGRCIEKSLPSLSKMTNAYSMRNKAEVTANKALASLSSSNQLLEDAYLKSYLNSLLTKINPSQRVDFFKYSFKVVVVKDDEPNAGIYPNGALVINAGMLARIHTEDELVALLCHEANHFICNHYLDNMAKVQKRETAGLIGSAIAGVATGILTGSVSLGAQMGSLSLSTAGSLNALITSMGLAFNQTQEKESDQAAVDMLPILGYDRNAMATCIQAIGQYYMEEGNLAAYYHSGSHPKIEDRIAATGIPYDRRDSEFERKVGVCVSYVSQQMYEKGRYSQAMELVNQNITNGVGRGMDYYIKGECLLATYDDIEHNSEARESLLKAREFTPESLPALKALIVTNLRLGNISEARSLLKEFDQLVKDMPEEQEWSQSMKLTIG